MTVVGARAGLDPTPATRRPGGLATRTTTARAGRMSRGEESRIAETALASAQPRTPPPNAGAKRPHQSRSDWLVRL